MQRLRSGLGKDGKASFLRVNPINILIARFVNRLRRGIAKQQRIHLPLTKTRATVNREAQNTARTDGIVVTRTESRIPVLAEE